MITSTNRSGIARHFRAFLAPKQVVLKRGKSFPYFEKLSIVFGKDRATGIAAESPADAAANIKGEETNQRASAQNPDEEMAIADESSGLRPTNSSAGQSRKQEKEDPQLQMTRSMNLLMQRYAPLRACLEMLAKVSLN
uniref:Uncharacterized protein n=1 Tax=Ananas comosus var. bracteatus TaxID=296719 RepID=A0A6V7PAN9_ANACO|nr:unnamed protein product [Ananas comosus var. bracteatus]